MRVTFGDHQLAMDLPKALDYGFRENGAMMAYVAGNDAMNLHVSTITATPRDPSRTNLAVERVAQGAREERFARNRVGNDTVFYFYEESGQWGQYQQRLYTRIVGYGGASDNLHRVLPRRSSRLRAGQARRRSGPRDDREHTSDGRSRITRQCTGTGRRVSSFSVRCRFRARTVGDRTFVRPTRPP